MTTKTLGIILAAGKGSRMQSTLPKVLHEVHGVPMVQRGIQALREAGIEEIVVVVGYRAELVRERLGDEYHYAMQTEQRGTGHAVMSAREYIESWPGKVVIVYGDAPLLNPDSIRNLIERTRSPHTYGALLSIVLPNPPAAGRIIRGGRGEFLDIVEVPDCTPEQLAIEEVNVGVYCFDAARLLDGLDGLSADNAQNEYYLTDVPGVLRRSGYSIEIVRTDDLLETLGVNDRHHLAFAESIEDIKHAESMYPIIDAAAHMGREPTG